MLLLIQSFD